MSEYARYEYKMPEYTARAITRLQTALDHDGVEAMRISYDGMDVSIYVEDRHGLHYVKPVGRHFFELKEVE